jgi:hypothetical protein
MGQQPAKTKINYIDNLRVLLTTLVILHHTFITYGAPGGWYYTQKTTNMGVLLPLTMLVSINQAFFMGFFFFLSALFTEPSYLKKGPRNFILDRLKRLGIPLLFYSFIFGPLLNYLVEIFGKGNMMPLKDYLSGYNNWVDFGVLWFVAALLVFTAVYVVIQKFAAGKPRKVLPVPGNRTIWLFALALGVISFLVRIIFPVGWVLQPVGFQLAHFTQYIAMFAIGIVASRSGWLNSIDYKKGSLWLRMALRLLLFFPLLYVVKIVTNCPLEAFEGRGTWQSLLTAVWEQLIGISIMFALLGIGRQKWNFATPLLQKMARSAYATYIIHPLFVISIALLLKNWAVNPAIKLLMAAPAAVVCSFFIAGLLVKLPGVKNVV